MLNQPPANYDQPEAASPTTRIKELLKTADISHILNVMFHYASCS